MSQAYNSATCRVSAHNEKPVDGTEALLTSGATARLSSTTTRMPSRSLSSRISEMPVITPASACLATFSTKLACTGRKQNFWLKLWMQDNKVDGFILQCIRNFTMVVPCAHLVRLIRQLCNDDLGFAGGAWFARSLQAASTGCSVFLNVYTAAHCDGTSPVVIRKANGLSLDDLAACAHCGVLSCS